MFGLNIEKIEEDVIKDYTVNKICISKIARKYHHRNSWVAAILDKYDIPHGYGVLRTGQSNEASKRVFTQEEKELIYSIYSTGGTTKDCIEAVHCGEDSLRRVLQELGIYRSHADVMKTLPQNQRKYYVNEAFFLEQSANMAYLLGFLASDGSVSKDRNDISLGLSSIDREILEKIQNIIGGRPIDDYITAEGFSVSKLTFTSQIVKNELAKYNITPKKTFTLTPPDKLEKKYWIDYIRGYFDGDGSINYIISNKSLRWQVCSATKEILQWIVDWLYEAYQIPKVNIQKQERVNSPLYVIQYSTNATKNIYNILYTPNTLFLKRKKDKFEEILKKK